MYYHHHFIDAIAAVGNTDKYWHSFMD